MPDLFPIISVPENARDSVEQMGSKKKFWYKDMALGRCLYKIARPNTGEDWSEKIAEQLANLLALPHAAYELAAWQDPLSGEETRGVVTPTLVPVGRSLIHGNELLVAHVRGYPSTEEAPNYGLRNHTLDAVMALIQQMAAGLPPDWEAPAGIEEPADLFLGYLFLDAWIGNTDRHHENWAYIELGHGCETPLYLAPTFDHASCLGRNESDANRERRLYTRDAGSSVKSYAAKARSALYGTETDSKPLPVVEAFRRAAAIRPQAAHVWLERLGQVTSEEIATLFERVPPSRLSSLASEFAQEMLRENTRTLLT